MQRIIRPAYWARICLLGAVFSVLSPTSGQAGNAGFFAREKWDFSVSGYGWLLGLYGDVTASGVPLELDIDSRTILENLEFAMMANARAYYAEHFGIFIDGVYGSVGSSGEATQGPVALQLGVDADLTIVTFGASYRFDPIRLGSNDSALSPSLTIEPYVGGRYYDVRNVFDVAVSPNAPSDTPLRDRLVPPTIPKVNERNDGPVTGRFTSPVAGGSGGGLTVNSDAGNSDGSAMEQIVVEPEFVDPVIGLRTEWEFSDRVVIIAAGDVGGFGVGSDFSWDALGYLGYRVGILEERDGMFFAGYRANGVDYSEGDGENRLDWSVDTRGPVVGFNLNF